MGEVNRVRGSKRIQRSSTRAFPTDVIVKQPLTPLSSSGSTGRSSIPETPDIEPRRLWNTGCPACAEHDIRENMKPRSRGAFCPSYAKNLDPPQIGGRRKGRVPARTRGPSREKFAQRREVHRLRRRTLRPSLRNGFTAYTRSPW